MKLLLHRLFALFTMLFCAMVIVHHGPAAIPMGVAVAFIALACIAGPRAYRRGQLGAAPDTNDVAADLNLNEILDAAIKAFKRAILPLTALATVFRNVQLKGTNVVSVPYYPLQGATSKDFVQATGYDFTTGAGSATAVRDITVNKRKYQPLALSGYELARLPMLNAQTLGELKGEKLAYDVIQDILSVILNANYGAPVFTGAAGAFDSDNIIDIRTACNKPIFDGGGNMLTGPWPEAGRSLILNPDYDGSLLKDHVFSQAYSIGTTQAVQEGRLPRIFGFQYGQSAAIPTNGENLVGFAAYMSAILAAFSPIEPPAAVRARMTAYEIVTDPDSEISIEYRVWGDPDSDTEKRVLECNYGYAPGEGTAIKRITSD